MGSRILVVEHEHDDPAHLVGVWLERAGAVIEPVRPYAGEPMPASLDDYDGVVVMGGAMGANDEDTVDWLVPLKELVRLAVADDVPMLGICLGHQVMSSALGGRVVRNPAGWQFGLIPVGWTEEARHDTLLSAVAARPQSRALQWNADIVAEAPEGAVLLARAATGEIQALRFAPRAWGLQWHPEVDESLVAPWLESDAAGIDRDRARAMLADLAAARTELDDTWEPMAARFAEVVAGGA